MQDFDKEQFYQEIGKKIKRERSISGINQEQLGKKVGISRVSVVNIEKGKQMPPVHVIWKIAAALDTTVERLFPIAGTNSSTTGLEKNVKLIGDKIKQDSLKSIFNQLHQNTND
jgi:DNA-binding XRE family transcriptional regulator